MPSLSNQKGPVVRLELQSRGVGQAGEVQCVY